MSGPALSVSTDTSESSTKKNEHRVPLQEVNRQAEETIKVNLQPRQLKINFVMEDSIDIPRSQIR